MIPARMLVPLYAVALFLGSLLLFGVQPMVTKMVLPRLGGSPAVWNTAQVFFQAMLLAGYLYAHVVTRFLEKRVRIVVHLALLASAFFFLPVGISSEWAPSLEGSPIPSLLGVLVLSIGLPFFAVATTAPLLQSWFSQTVHSSASDPYFLYSASNLGGLAALLGYPFLFEPNFGLARQGGIWAAGFAVLAVLIAVAGILLPRRLASADAIVPRDATVDTAPPPVAWPLRMRWLLLAFAPSSLMLGVTLHISTDIAASPFLWVVPLALYLLTFVISFSRKPALRHSWMLTLQPVLVGLLVVFFDTNRLALDFGLHLAAFFVTAMVCHGELVRTRPPAGRLTEFYIWLSLGGVLGGAFSGILAPLLFDSVLEYPIALVLACALRPGRVKGTKTERIGDIFLPVGIAFFYAITIFVLPQDEGLLYRAANLLLSVLVCVFLFRFRHRTVRYSLAVALMFLSTNLNVGPGQILVEKRSFFGVDRVIADSSGQFHIQTNGGTVHGAQRYERQSFRLPLTYYTHEGPAGQAFKVLRQHRPEAKIAAIGLGTGAITCLIGQTQELTFFEIDHLVIRLATNPNYFAYLPGCGRKVSVALGDGRRALGPVPDGAFDMLVLDAFSSDSVPAHLLTREAIALYFRKLAEDGILLIHVSNRYIDLEPVVAALTDDAGLAGRINVHEPTAPRARDAFLWASSWILVARQKMELERYNREGQLKILNRVDGTKVWTDDYSNVAGAIRKDTLW